MRGIILSRIVQYLFQPTSALPELEEQGIRLTQTNTGAGLLAFKKKSGSQSLRNTSEGFFFFNIFLNMYEARQDILRLNSMHL